VTYDANKALNTKRHPIPSAGSLLTLEDVLRGLCELLLPLNYLFNGRLGGERGGEG